MTTWITALAPEPGAPEIAPVSSAETVRQALKELGPAATTWCISTARDVIGKLQRDEPADDPYALTGLEHQACEASLFAVLEALVNDTPPQAPPEALEQVRLAVRQGATISSVMRTVWACHAGVQRALLDVVGSSLPADQVVDEVTRLTEHLVGFVSSLVRTLSTAYEEERAAWHGRFAAVRRNTVDQILEHGTAPEDADEILGLRLRAHHLAALAWPLDVVTSPSWHPDLMRYVTAVSQATNASWNLVLSRADGSVGIHWSYAGPTPSDVVRTARSVELPAGTGVAFGAPGEGIAGFRETAFAAHQASVIGHRRNLPGTWAYDEVALEALLVADPAAARRFVHFRLGPLAFDDPKTGALRRTLLSYLRHGRSRSAASDELHIAPTTVAYRVKQAEALLPFGVLEDPVRLAVVLGLAEVCPELLNPPG